ncbi:MAG: ATP-binding protein, partial [Acidobacteriota bacterium]|nr:ATP-binding protein [Acidobacteriota bacterium]
MEIIGRAAEIRELLEYRDSGKPEFVVVYGRRRVGKTFLIRKAFEDNFDFHFTGIAHSSTSETLAEFGKALRRHGDTGESAPLDWFEAFDRLRDLIEALRGAGRKIIFLDELPWMAAHKSGFIRALEHFWNGWASTRDDILLVVCGSATTWIADNILKNHGGLYGRVTQQLYLRPFTLAECEAYYRAAGLIMSRYQIVESYMIFGGIPYYLSLMRKGSFSANVDRLCFAPNGPLVNEHENLYASVFQNAGKYIAVIGVLATKRQGLFRDEIVSAAGFKDGGGITKILRDLELSGFVRKYKGFSATKKGAIYQLVDFFTLFYHAHIEKHDGNPHYWSDLLETPAHAAWSGYAFEQVCFAHIDQIQKTLGIDRIRTSVSAWRSVASSPGAQIDLVIDRADQVINLCEVKYSDKEYAIGRNYSA